MSSFFANFFTKPPQVPDPNQSGFPFTGETNPYRCQRTWPPDFSKLSTKHQFRLERRYRRRAKLKWARPNWVKGVKLAQWGSIIFVAVYGILFLDTGNGQTPFDGIRDVYRQASSLPPRGPSEASRNDDNNPTKTQPT